MTDQARSRTLRNWVEIVAFVAIVVADAFGLVPITQTLFLFASDLGVAPLKE